MELVLDLPYPPSVNHYWRQVENRTLISRDGRTFRRDISVILSERRIRPLDGPLAVTIDVYPPDKRRRDLDNALKALLDALGHGGAYHDDSQIDDLHIRRRECTPGGMVRVRLVPLLGRIKERVRPAEEEVPAEVPKPRTCLRCGKTFDSVGASNRICSPCADANARLGLSEEIVQRQRGKKRRSRNGQRDDDGDAA